ncbi:SDR family oxidoreductase [Parvularcula sp. ZS-1/3]|uniref:SDR family oxidoreductase n=1 Tax=Parvularcula mediterranea TaxID=2732508 RepID=A0A7Y3RK73_9PROT|nr:SDR family oxidoreductase [Parvularcula mediterranea]NNU15541.1 SDR family oxidoreductase [Parvularcula mediterranea]
MTSPINRRQMLAGAAAVSAAAATQTGSAAAQDPVRSLEGRSILITGCSSGFGRLMAEHFAEEGAKVFATMRNVPRPEAEELKDFASDKGVDLTVLEIDVTSDRQVAKATKKALKAAGGHIEVLVNNAGISYAGPVEMQDMKATEHMFQTNVYGPHRLARALLPAMREKRSGLIVQISSQLGRVIVPAYGQYSPTKFALEAMSEGMAYEVAPFGIDVNIIEPGGYPTKIWENSDARTESLLNRVPGDQQKAYGEMLAWVRQAGAAPRNTDPMDIPRAVAEIIRMPAGQRPLRTPVHPGPKPQAAINEVSKQTQLALMERAGMAEIGKTAYGVKA